MIRSFLYITFLFIIVTFPILGMAQDSSMPIATQDENIGSPSDSETYMEEEEYDSMMKSLELQEHIEAFLEDLNDLQNSYSRPFKITKDQRLSKSYLKRLSDDIKSNERKLRSIDIRWNIFYQAEQANIAADEELMTMVDDLNIIKSAVEDSIVSRQNILGAINDFNAAEKFLSEQDTIYKVIGRKAMELSMTSKTAPQLENLKVKEQIIFADIQSRYDKAKQGAQLFKVSQQDLDILDNRYANLKNKSMKIQEMAYQPFIQRIKDYLLGVAAVAIIIMFFNMVISKIRAAKKMRDNMKKFRETINQNQDNDIPSI